MKDVVEKGYIFLPDFVGFVDGLVRILIAKIHIFFKMLIGHNIFLIFAYFTTSKLSQHGT